jgi:hypothetical protein
MADHDRRPHHHQRQARIRAAQQTLDFAFALRIRHEVARLAIAERRFLHVRAALRAARHRGAHVQETPQRFAADKARREAQSVAHIRVEHLWMRRKRRKRRAVDHVRCLGEPRQIDLRKRAAELADHHVGFGDSLSARMRQPTAHRRRAQPRQRIGHAGAAHEAHHPLDEACVDQGHKQIAADKTGRTGQQQTVDANRLCARGRYQGVLPGIGQRGLPCKHRELLEGTSDRRSVETSIRITDESAHQHAHQ